MNGFNNADDNDFKILGYEQMPLAKILCIVFFVLLLLGLVAYGIKLSASSKSDADAVAGAFEQEDMANTHASSFLGGTPDSLTPAFAEKIDTVFGGDSLTIYIPHNATPELVVGIPDSSVMRHAVLLFQAADVRADNKNILGDFILKGKQLSRGRRDGFCAITDGNVTVGASKDAQLLEEARKRGGFFFRQRLLVKCGAAVDNLLQSKALHKALCDRNGQILVIACKRESTYNQFSQTLADFGVDNAIHLVGTSTWTVDKAGHKEQAGRDVRKPKYQNVSYIVWLPAQK